MSKSRNRFDDLLPDDDELFGRSKDWGKLFEKFQNKGDNEEKAVGIHEVPIPSDDDNEEETNEDETEAESIPVSEFEDREHEDDSNFNVQDVFNSTMKVVARRKENWHKSGIDRLMDSFCMDRYTDKVDDWLKKNTDYFSQGFNRRERCCSGAVPCIDEVQIKDHQVYVENGSDQDSFQSVDTAKYILSNRKKQRTRVRTMTIKRYCFSRKRMEELEREKQKSSENPHAFFDYDRGSEFDRIHLYNKKHSSESNESRVFRQSRRCYSEQKRKPKKRILRSSPSASSESSFSSDCKNLYAGRYLHNARQKKRNKLRPLKALCSSKSSTIESPRRRDSAPNKKRICQIETGHSKSENSIEDSEIKFRPENIVNSTALSGITTKTEPKILPPIDECILISSEDSLQEIIPQISEARRVSTDRSKSRNSATSPIVIYNPEDISMNLSKSIVNGKVVIDSKILEETIGPEFAKLYLKDKTDFLRSFDLKSKIIFYPPEPNVEASDSEADVLETTTKNFYGKIMVEVKNPVC